MHASWLQYCLPVSEDREPCQSSSISNAMHDHSQSGVASDVNEFSWLVMIMSVVHMVMDIQLNDCLYLFLSACLVGA